RRAREWELPAPMRCRVLGDAQYRIDERAVRLLALGGAAETELRTLIGFLFADEASLRARVSDLPALTAVMTPGVWLVLLRETLIDECGKKGLYPSSVEVDEHGGVVPNEQMTAASLATWSAATDKHVAIDPDRGRVRFVDAPADVASFRVSYF